MPDEEKKNEPMVDIDTSGPEVEVNLEQETKQEEPKETIKVEETEPKQEIEVKEETKEEETEDKKKELEDYSDGVQKRIAKLTKKWREAERQKEAALEYAKGVKAQQESLQSKLKTIEPNYVSAMEGRVTSGLQAAQAGLAKAREAGDIGAEVEAQKMIARLGVEEARVANLKKKAELEPKETVKTPTLDQALFQMTYIIRLVRAEMMEILQTDYIKFARARGINEKSIHYKHALKNGLIPVITIAGINIGTLIAFSIITETVFQWPGMGFLFIQAVQFVDIPIMSAYLVFIAFVFVMINFIVDILYYFIDPRIRVKAEAVSG